MATSNRHESLPTCQVLCTSLPSHLVPPGISTNLAGAVYYEQISNISTEARMMLWKMAGVVVYSAIREAVNVWPLEYITARSLAKVSSKGQGVSSKEQRSK
jgi:hypothetical protein